MRRAFSGSVVSSTLLVGVLLAAPLTTATAADRPEPRIDEAALVPMVEVDPVDFAAEAAELPPELDAALERDAGISGAEWLAQAEASAVGIEVVDALAEQIDVNGARLEGLELVVTVGSTADAAVVESVGATAEIGPEGERVGDPIEGLEPAADLRGGMPYTYDGFRCSVGFAGLDVSTLQGQMLSAGHCLAAGGTRTAASITRPTISGGVLTTPTQSIGAPGLHVTDDYPNPGYTDPTYYDYGLTPVTGSPWTLLPEVVTWGGASSGAPLASAPLVVRDAGPALVGATLCKSGATTGWTCGPITRVDSVERVGASSCPSSGSDYCVGSVVANICVRQGDSGGSALVGTRAVGVTSAATNGTVSTCSTTGNIGVFSTLYSANPAFEQVTKVYPNWEPLIGLQTPSISTGGVNRVESSLSGALPGGGVRHDVSLALDLGGTLTDEVDAAGAWSIDIGAVPNGTRSYTLRSTWGSGVQQSSTVSGRFLKAAQSRLFGDDRYATPVQIARAEFPGTPTPTSPVTPGVPVVYLANGASFPDALSAGPAAALEGGPMLLTPATSLPPGVAAELDRLNPERIVIVGGTGVVSSTVEAQAAVYATAVSNRTIRLGGENRYQTSQLIAQRMLTQGLSTGQALWVATGANFPDALSAGAAAAGKGVPILLVNGAAGTLDTATASFITNTLRSSQVDIAGGTGVVSPGIQAAIDALPSTTTVTRRGGDDRFATSLLINQAAYPLSAPEVFLAYGFNFPDALAGSVVAGLRGGPLYITETPCVRSGMVDHVLNIGPSRVTVFGGPGLVSDAARDLRRC
ncbi:cell wall-binding repeat-containing protein [Microcella sp.]|uniref:cell wall-binding repeat-containing protein n=1 Tax=Microcella sp. TaxID=1913979 RepID=UPI003F7203C4